MMRYLEEWQAEWLWHLRILGYSQATPERFIIGTHIFSVPRKLNVLRKLIFLIICLKFCSPDETSDAKGVALFVGAVIVTVLNVSSLSTVILPNRVEISPYYNFINKNKQSTYYFQNTIPSKDRVANLNSFPSYRIRNLSFYSISDEFGINAYSEAKMRHIGKIYEKNGNINNFTKLIFGLGWGCYLSFFGVDYTFFELNTGYGFDVFLLKNRTVNSKHFNRQTYVNIDFGIRHIFYNNVYISGGIVSEILIDIKRYNSRRRYHNRTIGLFLNVGFQFSDVDDGWFNRIFD